MSLVSQRIKQEKFKNLNKKLGTLLTSLNFQDRLVLDFGSYKAISKGKKKSSFRRKNTRDSHCSAEKLVGYESLNLLLLWYFAN